MSEISNEVLAVEPFLDLEDFMNFSRESRLEGESFSKLEELWKEWLPLLQVRNLKQDKNSWLAVWLPEEVEQFVDKAWEESPGKGYLIHNLAQYMCMAAVQDLIPQTAEGACAPSPNTSPECMEALRQETFLSNGDATSARRYGVFTYYPFKGGCEICTLQEQCPKGSGGEFASIVLPGHEKGKDK